MCVQATSLGGESKCLASIKDKLWIGAEWNIASTEREFLIWRYTFDTGVVQKKSFLVRIQSAPYRKPTQGSRAEEEGWLRVCEPKPRREGNLGKE